MADKPRDWANLLEKLLGAGRFTDTALIDWPFNPRKKVALRLLTDAEMEGVDTDTREWARALGLEVGPNRDRDSEYECRYAAEVLRLSLCDPETKQQLVDTVADLRSRITRHELNALIQAYRDYAEEMAPYPSQAAQEEEFEALAKALRGPFDARVLAKCVPSTLRQLAHYLANNWNPPSRNSPTLN